METQDNLPDLGISNLWVAANDINATKSWHLQAWRLFAGKDQVIGRFNPGKQLFAKVVSDTDIHTIWDCRALRRRAPVAHALEDEAPAQDFPPLADFAEGDDAEFVQDIQPEDDLPAELAAAIADMESVLELDGADPWAVSEEDNDGLHDSGEDSNDEEGSQACAEHAGSAAAVGQRIAALRVGL